MADRTVRIYTDGACRGNPGPGGWGALLIYRSREKELSGAEEHTTNNRMELTAAIEALQAVRRKCRIHLTTDSRYLMDGVRKWLPRWRRNRWLNSRKKPIANRDLWERLDELSSRFDIDWHWVKGHGDDEGNVRADGLANAGIDRLLAKRLPADEEEET